MEIPNHFKIGLEISAADEPVKANTTIMTKTCQLDVMFQRCLKLLIIIKCDKFTQIMVVEQIRRVVVCRLFENKSYNYKLSNSLRNHNEYWNRN